MPVSQRSTSWLCCFLFLPPRGGCNPLDSSLSSSFLHPSLLFTLQPLRPTAPTNLKEINQETAKSHNSVLAVLSRVGELTVLREVVWTWQLEEASDFLNLFLKSKRRGDVAQSNFEFNWFIQQATRMYFNFISIFFFFYINTRVDSNSFKLDLWHRKMSVIFAFFSTIFRTCVHMFRFIVTTPFVFLPGHEPNFILGNKILSIKGLACGL